jgi:hypothetical protein
MTDSLSSPESSFCFDLYLFTERVAGGSSTQAILGETIDRPGEDGRVFGARGKGIEVPHATAKASSKALKPRYGRQSSRLVSS